MICLTKRAVMENVEVMTELALNWAERQITLTSKEQTEIRLVCEEILVNIVHYAYEDVGEMTLEAEFDRENMALRLCFIDSGKAFNPLERAGPDIYADALNRTVGGLGIFIVKQIADSVTYVREREQNKLTVVKVCRGMEG